jgi:hypothetical protein
VIVFAAEDGEAPTVRVPSVLEKVPFVLKQTISVSNVKSDGMPASDRKAALLIKANSLNLSEEALSNLIAMLGPRYSTNSGQIKLVADRYSTFEQNRDYLLNVMKTLIETASDFPPRP